MKTENLITGLERVKTGPVSRTVVASIEDSVNTIRTVKVIRGKAQYFEIEVDGKRLAQHFAGPRGAHPSQLSLLGWSSSTADHRAKIVAQLLAESPSELKSGRVPVLVCEECGDIGCGAFAARVLREGEYVRWTDWAFENGSQPAEKLTWPTRPGDLIFERKAYEIEIRKAVW